MYDFSYSSYFLNLTSVRIYSTLNRIYFFYDSCIKCRTFYLWRTSFLFANELLSKSWSWLSLRWLEYIYFVQRYIWGQPGLGSASNCAPLVASDCFQPTILINRTCQFSPIFVFVAPTYPRNFPSFLHFLDLLTI